MYKAFVMEIWCIALGNTDHAWQGLFVIDLRDKNTCNAKIYTFGCVPITRCIESWTETGT